MIIREGQYQNMDAIHGRNAHNVHAMLARKACSVDAQQCCLERAGLFAACPLGTLLSKVAL